MRWRLLTALCLAQAAACAAPPDVVIEVGSGRPAVGDSGSGSGDGSSATWVAPGQTARSILAVERSSGSGWGTGVVVAGGAFIGVFSDLPAGSVRWRDANGREGTATVAAVARGSGLYLAKSDAIVVPPIAMAERVTQPIVSVIGHPTFGLNRGGWLTLELQHAMELCDNGIDDDGNGAADCGDGACAADPSCTDIWPEDCRNGADDDGDGLTDCGDRDCDADLLCTETCDPAAFLPLPNDVGLDGGALLDGCGRLAGLVGLSSRRSGSESDCTDSERTAVPVSAPLEPLACVSGHRPFIGLGRIRALLDAAAVEAQVSALCGSDETTPISLSNDARGMAVSGATLSMLRRARSMVYAGPGFSAVKVASPPLLVAPTSALPRLDERSDDLVSIDGTTVSLASSFQRPEPISGSLSAIFYPTPTTSGFPLAERDEAVAGNEYYLIGQPDTLGCGAGWVVNMVKLVAFGTGDELIFEGAGYSAGAAIVTPTGGLLAVATDCEAATDESLAPAEASEEPLTLAKNCAIIGSRIPTR